MNQNLNNKRKLYYNKIFVLFELLKSMKHREVVFMDRKENWKCIRGLYIKNIDFLKESFEKFNFFEKDYNIYISTATFSEIPPFTFDLTKRSEQTRSFFENDLLTYATGYDCLLDFDAKDSEEYLNMFSEVVMVYRLLKRENIMFYTIPSGNNFQIVIPSYHFPYDLNLDTRMSNEESFNSKIRIFVKTIKERFNLKYLDLYVNTGSLARIMKCPYSLVDERVCLPLRSIEGFEYSSVDSNKVLKNVQLKNRGIVFTNQRTHEGLLKLPKIMEKFIQKYNL